MTRHESEPRPSQSLQMETTWLSRIGLAIVRPTWALAIAGGRRHPGRSGSDLLLVILLVLAATQLRAIMGAFWLAGAVDFGLGVRAVVQVLTRSLTGDLAFLVVAALLLWGLAGKRRDLGRAFDLACVAALPLLLVDLGASVIVRAIDIKPPLVLAWAVAGVSWAWTGALVAYAIRFVRVAPSAMPAPAIDGVLLGRRAGWGVVAIVLVGVVLHGIWVARNLDLVRPVTHGDPAPALSLPVIADGNGTLGAPRSLADYRGKIVVVDFWATWCKPCLKAMPQLEALEKLPDVEVLAINLDEPGRAFTMFREANFTMTLLADDGEASERYGVSTIPHTVVIDRNGNVHAVHRGGGDIRGLVEQIRK